MSTRSPLLGSYHRFDEVRCLSLCPELICSDRMLKLLRATASASYYRTPEGVRAQRNLSCNGGHRCSVEGLFNGRNSAFRCS